MLVGLGCRMYRDDPELGYINPETFGHSPTDLFLIRSIDGGRSWSEPQFIDPPLVGPAWETCHPIVELANGCWLAPMGTWKGWDGDAPNGMKSISLVSYDKGLTWPEQINELDDWANGYMYIEQALVQLKDGRLLVSAWGFTSRNKSRAPTAYAISEDGKTFGPR